MLIRELTFAAIGTGFTCLATVLGAAMVFFFREDLKPATQKIFLGFAAGVMVAASVWSLLIPSMEMAEEMGQSPALPVGGGFLLGGAFLMVLDRLTPHLHIGSSDPEGLPAHLSRTTMIVLAVSLHKIPEGMAVGLAFSMAAQDTGSGALAGAVLLAIGGFLALAAWAGSPRTLLGQRTMSIAWAGLGVLSLLAAAGIYFVAQKMRRGAPILTAWAVVPGFACCLWIMANYYQSWAEEPVLGQYLIPMLGALLSMIACFLVGGFAFGKARVTLTLTVCLAAGAFNIMALADGLPLADTALYLGMMFYLLSMAAALARNDAKPEAPPACAPNCAGCQGCAPMGTQGGQPPAGTDGQTPDQPQ